MSKPYTKEQFDEYSTKQLFSGMRAVGNVAVENLREGLLHSTPHPRQRRSRNDTSRT